MRRSGVVVAAALVLLLAGSRAGAHHALNAFYDLDSPVRIEGALQEYC